MRALIITVFVPLATAICLLHIRHKHSPAIYVLSSLPFIAGSIFVWLSTPYVRYYYGGPLEGGFFSSWAAPAAVLSIVFLCAYPLPNKYLRIAQGAIALLAADFWLIYASTVA